MRYRRKTAGILSALLAAAVATGYAGPAIAREAPLPNQVRDLSVV